MSSFSLADRITGQRRFLLSEILHERELESSGRTAYTFLDEAGGVTSLSYGELGRQARAIAAWLQQLGGTGQRALLLYPPGQEFVAAFLGCLGGGIIAVPIQPMTSERGLPRLLAIARDARATFALTTTRLLGRFQTFAGRLPELASLTWVATDQISSDVAEGWQAPRSAPESLAFLQYTSGSTALPKGVQVSHGNLLHNEEMIQRAFGQSADSVIVGWLPLYHDMGLIGNVLQPLHLGAHAILMPPVAFLKRPLSWLEAITRYRATTSGGPNFAYELCLRKIGDEQRAGLDLSSWEVAFNGAEPVRSGTLERFARAFAPQGFRRSAFYPCYGLAEATLFVTGGGKGNLPVTVSLDRQALERREAVPAASGEEGSSELVGCGHPWMEQRIAIVDPDSERRLREGLIGEIWVAGPSVAQGYWGRPEETGRDFHGHLAESGEGPFLRTGDLGFLQGGELFVTGRLKDLIILRGRNLYPQDIELSAEGSHPELRAGCSAAFPADVEGEERLILACELEPRARAPGEVIAEAIRQAVAQEHEVQPHEIVLLEPGTIPKTSSGKIQRHACRRRYLAGGLAARWRSGRQEPAEAAAVDHSPIGEEVARVLGVPAASLDPRKPLTAYGLDSLGAVEVQHALESRLGAAVDLADLLRGITLQQLADQVRAGSATPPIRPVTRRGSLPLSFAQERLWFIDQLEPGSAAYNLPAAVRLKGRLDAPALAASLQEIVRRHEALRTTFAMEQGRPAQRIAPAGSSPLPVVDLSGLAGGREVAQGLAAEEGRRGFDLARGPLWRGALLRLAAEEHLLLLTLHHIVSDGWSMGVLARELSALYAAFAAGRPSPLKALPVQYADFAAWQRQHLSGEVLEEQLAHWRRRLAGAPALDLPGDRLPLKARGARGATQSVEFPLPLAQGLGELARREGVTLFMVLLGGFAALLSRWTGQDDVSFGTAIAGRNRAETEGLIGFFANTLVLRTDLSGEPSGRDLLARAREVALAAYAHQDLPFERLVQELQPRRGAEAPPLFRAVLTLGADPALGLALPGLAAEPRLLETGTAKFDLTLQLWVGELGPAGVLEYSAELFDAPTPRRLIHRFSSLLEGLAADPGQPVAGLPLLTPAESHQLLAEWSGAAPRPALEDTIPELFARQVRRRPDAVAVSQNGQALTYAELDRRANLLARHLRRLGVGPEVPAGVYLERSPELIVALVAVAKSGGAYLPLDPSHPRQRREFILAQTGAPVVLTREGLRGDLPGRALCLDGEAGLWDATPVMTADPAGAPAPAATPENLAYILYTSGSTGEPKGVAVTHRSVVRLVRDTGYASFGSEEVFLQFVPVAFDVSTFEIWGPLLNGGRLALAPAGPVALAELERVIARERVTTLWLTAGLFHQAVDQGVNLHGLRQLLAGGDVLSPPHARRALEQTPGCVLVNGYGPTENTTFTSCHRMTRPTDVGTTVSIGRPIARTSVFVVDPAGQPSPVGVPGELWAGGDGLARGYVGRPDLTAERFVPHPFGAPGARLYRTGDQARFLPDGSLEFLGRIDQQVKIRGFRIEPGEIEAVLAAHPGVAAIAVVPREVGPDDRRLMACVVARPGQALDFDELRELGTRQLPGYMVPSAFVALPALPLTANGKVDRQALSRLDWDPAEAPSATALPRNPTEELLAGLWAELLGLEVRTVGIDADFFQLGGHSLLATRLVSRIREDLRVEVPLRGLFAAPTPAGLARLVLATREGPEAPPIRPVPRTGSLPLSFAQERLWFLDQLEPGSPTYNIPAAVRLAGRLDIPALAAGLQEIVGRHEALRTTFAVAAGRPVQRIAPPGSGALPVVDLSGLAGPWEPALRLGAEESQRGFDLERGPLWRAALLRLAGEEHLLLLTLHHIVSDGWSMGVLVRELSALYKAFVAGRPSVAPAAAPLSPLSPLPVQYADVAAWQRQLFDGGGLAAQSAYWRRQLADLDPLRLPTDRPSGPARSSRGASVTFLVSSEARAGLETLARRERTTLFMVLLGGFQALLSRYTGQQDIAVGTAIANRNRAETEALIGFFVNTLVLRTDLSGDPDRRELLRRVREVTLDAYAHQDLPFEKLVEELAPERDLGRSPLTGVLLVLQNMPLPELALPGVTAEPVPLASRTSRLDLTLSLDPQGEGLAGWLELSTDLFDEATVRRMTGHFEQVLQGLANASGAPGEEPRLSALSLLTPAEREQLLVEWNDTGGLLSDGRCLHELIAARASAHPEAAAVVCGSWRLTYRELERRANRLAHHLRALGAGAETLVGVCLERGPELVPALLAILKAGGAYVPLDPAYPQERLAMILDDARAPILVTQASLASRLDSGAIHVLVDADREAIAARSAAAPPSEAGPDQLAYLIYTSGSTGRPKGVAITHRSAVVLAHWCADRFSAAELAGVLASTSVCFDVSIFELLVTLSQGGTLLLAADVLALPELPAASEVTLICMVPSAAAELVRLAPAPPGLRTINLGGEPVQRALVQQLERWQPGVRILNLYGPSEDTTYSTWATLASADGRIPAIGRPVAGTSVYLLDRHGNPVPLGVPGELHIAGSGLARGYFGRPELTAAKFLPDPFAARPGGRLYATGDLARLRPDGNLEFLGRLDHQVKIRGFRVEPGEIEAVLAAHPGVEAVAVVPQEAAHGDHRLAAYVIARPGQVLDLDELRGLAARRLPGYMVPAAFVTLPALPLTPNGKLDRRSLPRPDWTRGEAPGATATPRNGTEELLVALWAELLGLEAGQVGIDTNFFTAGGHSLLATRLVSRVREDLRVEVRLRDLFEDPTPAGLARRVLAAREGLEAPPIRPVPRTGSLPLSFAQERLWFLDRLEAPPIRPVPRTGSLPLSFAQERLWFLDRLEPGDPTYNIHSAVRLEGRLDVPALAAALQEVVRRHEVLRTVFAEEGGGPVQRIVSAATGSQPVVDLSGLTGRWEAAQRLSAEESRGGFDLERGPLWRAALLRLGSEEHLLLLTLHHVVADGWSMGVFVRELSALYGALVCGRPSPLPELPVQYADFALWQRAWLSGEVLESQLSYWRRQLAGSAVLELPTDRPHKPGRSSRGSSVPVHLSPGVRAGLEELAQRERVTLFMVLLGGFQALLARYADQEDLAVGTAIANRNRAETEGLIGFFVNTLVLRTDLSGDPDRRELLRRVREVTLDAYAHQDVPFEKLVENLAPERDLSRPPLTSVLLVLQNMALPELALPGVTARPLPVLSQAARLDLTLSLTPQGEGLTGFLEFSTDLFDEATVLRMLARFERVLRALAETPEQEPRVSTLPLLTPAEREELLADWDLVQDDRCLHELITAQAAATPEAVAVVCGSSRLTYGDIERQANHLAHHLRSLGVGPEVPVGVCLERGPELVPALLAVLKAGGAYVPLDPAYPQERLAVILEDARVPVLVTQSSLVPRLAARTLHVLVDMDRAAIEAHGAEAPPSETGPDHLAYFIFTSGSTGRPKGVAIAHRSAVALVRWSLERFSAAELAGVLASTSVSFDVSVFELLVTLSRGGTLILATDALALPELPAAAEVTLICMVPSAITELIRLTPAPPGLLTVNLGGEPVQRSLVQQLERWRPGLRILNLYGPSEDTTYTTWAALTSEDEGNPPIGRPVTGTSFYVLDRHGNLVPRGVPGELYIGGAGLSRGYFGRPELTAAKFVPHPFAARPGERLYATGDLARLRPDGDLELLGRRDHQVKVRGFRVELGEIEAALAGHPAVREAAVLAREGSLAAYLTLDRPAEPAELRAFLHGKLPAYMVPGAFVVLDAFPLLPNGKLDRRALPAPAPAPVDLADTAPRGPLEELVAGILAATLGMERIGREDDFFELGGHSLLATRAVSRLRAALAVDMPLRQLFETPTAAALAGAIGQRAAQTLATEPPIMRTPRALQTSLLPLSFAQERLWFLDQLQPGTAAYNMPAAVRLEGRLDVAALASALGEVVRRHEALRTVFSESEGRPVQRVSPWAPRALAVIDLSALPPADRASATRRLALEEARRPFDLAAGEGGWMTRGALVRLGPSEHFLLATVHHIAADGWSVEVILAELAALYGAVRAGRPSPLAELPLQYTHYALWQRSYLQGEELEARLAYWRRKLAGSPVALDLPADRPRPVVASSRGAVRRLELPAALTAELQALAQGSGATLFMVLLAAWQALLARYSGQEDVVVGSPVANRERLEIEPLIGFFVNTLVLRLDLSGDPTFTELSRRARETALEAFAHQDLPFEKLVEELAPVRDPSRTPLFQIMFTLQSGAPRPPEFPGLAAEVLEVESGTAKFDLGLSLRLGESGISGTLEYSADLFEGTTAERMLAHFRTLLAGVTSGSGQRLSGLPLLTEAERHQIAAWNDGWRGPAERVSVHALVERQADLAPDAVAVELDGERLTYGELEARANRLARALRRLGAGPEVPVGVCLERSPERVVALLAVLKAGGVYLPIDPAYPERHRAYLMSDSGARVLLTRETLPDCAPESPERLGVEVDPPQAAYVIYTSGATGEPKGVVVGHGEAAEHFETARREYGLTPGDRVLQFASPGFDVSLEQTVPTLAAGATLVLRREELWAPAELLARLEELAVTVADLPTAYWQSWVPELAAAGPPAGGTGLRLVIAGGEAMAPGAAHLWGEVFAGGPGLLNAYGPTEAVITATVFPAAPGTVPPAVASVPIGRPLAGRSAWVLDRRGSLLPAGVPGELCLGGLLARGYLGRPALTAERFVPDPFSPTPGERLYRTGDLARHQPDGTLEYLGRIDEQIKVRGFRIEPGEIEAALARHPAVAQAAVVVAGEGVDRWLVAFLVGEAIPNAAGLRAFLGLTLPGYKVPSAFVDLPELPLTPNGKVDRRALALAVPESHGEAFIAPATPAEQVLAGIWAEVLRVERVSATDDFFTLGGHSLLATQVQSRVREAFGVELPLRGLFETPTVAAQAAEIEALKTGGFAAPPPRSVPRSGESPLSFAQERLWFLDQLQPGNASYNMPVAARLRGHLDPALLARSLDEIVRRHETLRTTFGAVDGQPFQRIAERLQLLLPLLDLSGLAPRERDAEIERLVAAEKATPFDLERGPLVRARLFRLADEDWVFLIDLHHIISDGLSLRRLFSELAWLYAAFAAGEPSPLPELEVQYADYAHWQRQWLQGEALERHLDYWRRQLSGTLPVLDLPTDRVRPPIQTFRGGSQSALLPGALGAGLRALGRRQGATLFMTLFAGFNLLLHRYSGQEDVLVGIPIAGRNRPQIEDLIGFFINSLVLRTDLSGQPAFSALLARVRQAALDSYAHQDLSFERLLQELRLERDLSRTPLFQVYFNFQNFAGPLPAMPGLTVESLSGEEEFSKFDLTLYALEEGDGQVRLDLVYNAALFSAGRCREMLDQYVALLAQAAAQPDAGIDAFSLLTLQALRLLPDPAEELDAGWIGPVHRSLTAWAARDPERPAVTDPTGTWSYGELEARSNRLARLLLADGVRKGETVAIYAHRSATLVWAVLGVLKAGAAFVALDPSYPPARIVEILRLARPRAWLAMAAAGAVPEPLAGFVAGLPGCLALTLPPWNAEGAPAGDPGDPGDPGVPIGPDDLAYVAFTSGSTGIPKGVLGRHGPLSHFLPWQREEFGLAGSDRFSLLSGLAHDPLQRDLFTPLFLGARICIPDPAEIIVPGKLSAWMRRAEVTVAHLTPAMGQVLTESGPQAAESLPALRHVFLVGDILTRRDVARLQRLAPGVTCVNLYGSTETQRAVGYHVVAADVRDVQDKDKKDKEVLPLGRGMKDVQLLVRNRAGQRAGIGELGEIAVRSPHLAGGYLGDEAATAGKFLDNPVTGQPGDRLYLTGDLGRYLPDGEVVFAGRADSQVKIRGFRIELGEIESQLGRIHGVREAVVLATEDGGAGSRLMAFVVAEPGAEGQLSAADLRNRVKAILPAYMVPSSLLFLPEIPLTPNRKIDRRALLQRAGSHREDSMDYRAPQTEAELLIAGILREVLEVERVGTEDNFFDLGGNSLLLLKVQSRLQAAFNRELPVFELFSNPTVSALARHLAPPEPDASARADAPDDAAGQLAAGRKRRQRRFQQNQKAADRRPGGLS